MIDFFFDKKIEVACDIFHKFPDEASINTHHLIPIRLQRVLLIISILFISRDHCVASMQILYRRVVRDCLYGELTFFAHGAQYFGHNFPCNRFTPFVNINS